MEEFKTIAFYNKSFFIKTKQTHNVRIKNMFVLEMFILQSFMLKYFVLGWLSKNYFGGSFRNPVGARMALKLHQLALPKAFKKHPPRSLIRCSIQETTSATEVPRSPQCLLLDYVLITLSNGNEIFEN